MRKFTKILGLSTGILALGMMASCSNEGNEPDYPAAAKNSVLVHAPSVTAWSGSENFGGSTGTRAAEAAAPAAVTQSEVAAAKAYFNSMDMNHVQLGGKEISIDDLAGWKNYYVQEVASGNRLSGDLAIFVGTNDDEIVNIAIWDLDPAEVVKLLNTDEYLTNSARVNVDPSSSPLVTDHPIKDFSFDTNGYTYSGQKVTGVRSSGNKGIFPNYLLAELDGEEGAAYVAFYGYTDQNNGFWNRIIKITKVDLPDDPVVEEPAEDDAVESEEILHNNEVEVNLSVMDSHRYYNDEELITKLSIHVRTATDVTVRIPVPVEILVPKDDLDIAIRHPELVYGENHKASFEINGNTVELNVRFTDATDCAGVGYGYYIEVSTKGINQDVIDYCMQANGDGVNFEVFNYFTWNTTDADGNVITVTPTAEQIEDLRENWLNKSSVEFGFTDLNNQWNAYYQMRDYPYYYINAFGNQAGREKDCVVKVISNQSDAYENYYVGAHLNASENNVVYVREDIYNTAKQDKAHRPNYVPPVPTY